MHTNPNSLIIGITSKSVAVSFLLPLPLKASGLVIMGEDNTYVFCEGLECTDLTEWLKQRVLNAYEPGFQVLVNATCHSNGNV